mmetsp:Transcript_7555/g.14356  ORF Transcript_7555/g.14356 Transcript_7555/m.14356 type:complete len:288 (-) Transcript_7555:847-1710(-)
MALKQPIGQKRLTNIALVKYKKHGKKFEIACYRNTVLAWRSKVETDIDEVLQTQTVFVNVSKGVLAKAEDLKKVFGTTDQLAICKQILDQGALQVSDKERAQQLDSLFRDVVNVLVEKCINRDTQRPYPSGIIERSLRDLHFAVDPTKPAKVQALEALPELRTILPIERARMRLRVQIPETSCEAMREELKKMEATIESESTSGAETTLVFAVEPGAFRRCDQFVREECKGRLEVVALAVQSEADSQAEFRIYGSSQRQGHSESMASRATSSAGVGGISDSVRHFSS